MEYNFFALNRLILCVYGEEEATRCFATSTDSVIAKRRGDGLAKPVLAAASVVLRQRRNTKRLNIVLLILIVQV